MNIKLTVDLSKLRALKESINAPDVAFYLEPWDREERAKISAELKKSKKT